MVKWVELGEMTDIVRGKRLTKGQILTKGEYPVISGGITPMGYYNEYNRNEGTITISQYGSAGYVDYQYSKFWANDICYCLYPHEFILNRYLWHILKSKQNLLYSIRNIEAIPYYLSIDKLKSVVIPLPTKEEQERIVGILDKYEEMVKNVEREKEMREKQYESYRERLIAEGRGKIKTLDEIGTITRGKRFVRTDIVEEGQPCIHYGDMYTYYGIKAEKAKTHLKRDFPKIMRYAQKGDVVIVGAGENNEDIGIGLVWMGDEPAAVHDACYIFAHNQNPMYISYFLRTKSYHSQLKKYVSEGKICSFSGNDLGKIKIPMPSLTRQREIVEKLDRFEQIIENLKRERELREKQYKYYREKLLTF